MNTHDDNALTPEERALAQRLARLGAQAEPSAALDARILAAAHAAASAPPADAMPMRRRSDRRQMRRPARWPTVFGFAASLALAFGIAWQLRPVPPAPGRANAGVAHEEPLADYQPPAPGMSIRAVPPRPLNMPEPPPAEAQPGPRPARRKAAPVVETPVPQAFEHEQPFVDEALPAHSHRGTIEQIVLPPAAEAAATAAPAAPPMQRAAPAPAAAPAAKMSGNVMQPQADAASERRRETTDAMSVQTQAADAAATRQQTYADEPDFAEPDEEVVPPATADDPQVRDAWLLRIRELVRAGKPDAARESLRAFRARYPQQPVPDDLRALEK
jgi:hypothetical protein